MCGRYLLATPVSELARTFGFAEQPNLPARYNVAPTQEVPIVRAIEGGRSLGIVRWGLVPSWADDVSIGSRMINARSETAAEKPAFRQALRKRRCLVPADGFYEWKAGGKEKQPYLIRRRDRAPFAFAGLWEAWHGPKGGPAQEPPLLTDTILTTTANGALRHLHERMPVILDRSCWDLWLDPKTPVDVLQALMTPAPDDLLDLVAVSKRVNAVRNDDRTLTDPVDPSRDAAPGAAATEDVAHARLL